jgi:hypothetical protein
MDYRKEIIEQLQKNDLKKVEELANTVFKVESENENLLAFAAAIIFNNEILSSANLIFDFVEKFPHSLHPIRVYLADLLTRQKNYDAVTTEARIYLRIALENGQFKNPSNDIMRDSIGRSFYFLTCAYTDLGARDYSKRILKYAFEYATPHWAENYKKELLQLDEELQTQEAFEINKKWEQFFENGSSADELYDLCIQKKFNDMAIRIDLLEGQFRFNNDFKVDKSEILKLIYGTDKEGFVLQ